MLRIRFNHPVVEYDAIIESDLIEATLAEWEDMPESRSGAWSVHRDGHRVLANRLEGIPVIQSTGTTNPAVGL